MKKLLSILLVVVLIVTAMPLGAFEFKASAATSGTTGDCTWSLDGTVLTICGEGNMGNYNGYNDYSPWGTNITSVIIKDGVTSIGDYAFYKSSKILSITIPDGIMSIGYYAFCDCKGLTNITIPDSVVSIESNAFLNTTYYNNSDNWENNVLYINRHLIRANTSISGEYCIKEDTLTIANSSFSDCKELINIEIPNSIKSNIGSETFYNCRSLSNILIPNGVTDIGDYAFYNCISLRSITIPDSVTSIGHDAFYYCMGLNSINIPDSVIKVGADAFEMCRFLEKVYITNIVSWCNIDFGNSYSNPLFYAEDLF